MFSIIPLMALMYIIMVHLLMCRTKYAFPIRKSEKRSKLSPALKIEGISPFNTLADGPHFSLFGYGKQAFMKR